MPPDSQDSEETTQNSSASDASPADIAEEFAADEPVPNSPPRHLMGPRLKLYSWLLIALLLGALIAFFLVGLSD
ncbi:MAG TPA: hypothetical protein VIC00_01140 [Candidatus Acidoferrales bacterium]